ncbi:unnamed protein product, partial [Staurois parvus]
EKDLPTSPDHPPAEQELGELINVTLPANQSGNLSQHGMGQVNSSNTTEAHTHSQLSPSDNQTLNITQVPSRNISSAQPDRVNVEVGLLQLIGDPPPEQITKIFGPDKT